jgi:hypothetical protein
MGKMNMLLSYSRTGTSAHSMFHKSPCYRNDGVHVQLPKRSLVLTLVPSRTVVMKTALSNYYTHSACAGCRISTLNTISLALKGKPYAIDVLPSWFISSDTKHLFETPAVYLMNTVSIWRRVYYTMVELLKLKKYWTFSVRRGGPAICPFHLGGVSVPCQCVVLDKRVAKNIYVHKISSGGEHHV